SISSTCAPSSSRLGAARRRRGSWRSTTEKHEDLADRGAHMADVRHVALLRGINVGRAKRVAMADLRALFEELGYGEVRTLLNSGNVVFTARAGNSATIATRIEKALTKRLGISTRVIVITAGELATIIAKNPLLDVAANP